MMLDRPRHKEIVETDSCRKRVVAHDRRRRHRCRPRAVAARVRCRSLHGHRRFSRSGARCSGNQVLRRRQCNGKMWLRAMKRNEKKPHRRRFQERSRPRLSADDLAKRPEHPFLRDRDHATVRWLARRPRYTVASTRPSTHSILMRAQKQDRAFHSKRDTNLQTKTIRLRSDNREHLI